jgi:membrane protein YdbS with pleckstrin-like domain
MSGVRVDTAGSGEWSHRVHIPYLDASVARDLVQRVSTAAARTDFYW